MRVESCPLGFLWEDCPWLSGDYVNLDILAGCISGILRDRTCLLIFSLPKLNRRSNKEGHVAISLDPKKSF